jgi:hypothetical protein
VSGASSNRSTELTRCHDKVELHYVPLQRLLCSRATASVRVRNDGGGIAQSGERGLSRRGIPLAGELGPASEEIEPSTGSMLSRSW